MVITESAMVCAVGHTAASACAAKRACLSGFGELPFRDGAGEPVIGAPVAILEWTLPRSSRLLAMLGMALEELLHQCAGSQWERVALLVCLAEPGRPGWNAELADFIIPLLQEQLGVTFHRTASRVLNAGPTGAFEALRVAHEALAVSNVGACVVCGVDSFIDAATLRWLDGHYRLKTAANRDGLIPGEAAAAVLVRAAQAPDAGVEVAGLGFGIEAAHLLSGEPLLAHGLTTAVREALEQANVGLHEIDLRLSDVTGELYGFRELPLVEGRLMRVVRKQPQPLWHWAEAIGDTGAAAGVAQLVWAHHAFRRRYAPGPQALCLASSVNGGRAAAVLRCPSWQ